MTNLYKELIELLEEHKLSINDIEWCGIIPHHDYDKFEPAIIDTTTFLEICKWNDYGFNGNITDSLVVCGIDWWIEFRYNDDGYYSWWEFFKKPQEPTKHYEPNRRTMDDQFPQESMKEKKQ